MADQENPGFMGVDPADWLAMGQGLLSGPNWAQGVSQGVGNVREARRYRTAQERQKAMDLAASGAAKQKADLTNLQMDQIRQKMESGDYMQIAPGAVMNRRDPKDIIYADPTELAKLKAASAPGKGAEFVAQPPVLDEEGNLWLADFNKANRTWTFTGPGGVTRNTPPPGASRPTDSLHGEQGKIDKKIIMDLQKDYGESRTDLQTAQRSLDLLQSPEVWTGVGAETIATIKSAMVSAGFASQEMIDSVAGTDEFRTLSFEFVMQQVAGTKGAVSDREMDLFAKASPGLGKTTQGNQRILEGIKMIAKRKQEQYEFMNEKMLGKGMPGWKAELEWQKHIDANPLFTKEWFAETESYADTPTAVGDPNAARLPNEPEAPIDDIMKKYQ